MGGGGVSEAPPLPGVRDHSSRSEHTGDHRHTSSPPHLLPPQPALTHRKRFYTAKYVRLMATYFPAWALTLPGVIYRLDFAPQFTLSDPTHIGGFILM